MAKGNFVQLCNSDLALYLGSPTFPQGWGLQELGEGAQFYPQGRGLKEWTHLEDTDPLITPEAKEELAEVLSSLEVLEEPIQQWTC